jgi:hypothetical protein
MSFEDMFKTNKGWCLWTRNKHKQNPRVETKYFCDWLDNKLKEMDESFVINLPINVSTLSKIVAISPSFNSLLGCFPIHRFDFPNKKKWTRPSPSEFPPNLFGVFMDYVMRHYISTQIGQPFVDHRANLFAVDDGVIDPPKKVCDSYNLVKNSTDTKLVLREIFYASTAHTAFWGEGYYEHIEYDENFLPLDIFQIIARCLDIFSMKSELLLNPAIGNSKLGICGDADLIVDDEIIDFKTSMREVTMQDFIQLYLYALLYHENTGKYIKRLTILNPLMMVYWTIDISDWDGYENVKHWIESRGIRKK